MNKEIEGILRDLLKRHGHATVREHLTALLPQALWADWQRLDSWVKNTANAIERENA